MPSIPSVKKHSDSVNRRYLTFGEAPKMTCEAPAHGGQAARSPKRRVDTSDFNSYE